MSLNSLPSLGKTECWLQPCDPVPSEAQKLPLQLVLCRLSLELSPQNLWLWQRPGLLPAPTSLPLSLRMLDSGGSCHFRAPPGDPWVFGSGSHIIGAGRPSLT